jgi:outer membrane protein assembly factor BamB
MKRLIIALPVMILAICQVKAQASPNWRGQDRSGIYRETGLLQEWPAQGPEILWVFEQLGMGYSSPVFSDGKIFITGMEEQTGYVYVMSMQGTLLNKFPIGPEHPGDGYPGSRSTPAVAGNLVYAVSSQGELVCIDHTSGSVLWRRNLFNDFDGRNIRWGYTESLLVDGDLVFVSPGGRKHNIVALNRHTGEIAWSSPGAGGVSAYCSPLLVDHYGRKMLITHMKDHVVGLDAGTGRLMWSYTHKNRWDVHPNTPIYHAGSVYAFSGYGQGGVRLKINSVGDGVTPQWTNDLDNQMGGVVLVDGRLYGSGQNNRFWLSVDWETGQTLYTYRDIAKGTVIWADGRLYCYSERGELALLEPGKDGFTLRGRTSVTHGSNQHWAHPVINNGVLYIRRGNALIAYKII